jgi:tetratricopeptide (TPR) repeat protein
MRFSSKFLALATLYLAGTCASPILAEPIATAPAPAFAPLADSQLLGTILRASGVEFPAEVARYEASLRRALSEVARDVGHPRSEYRRARRLHEALHRRFLKRYDDAADGIDAILDRGEFNCLSASLFYGLAARVLGLDVQVMEIPRHVFVRFRLESGDVDVETTSTEGFDLRRKLDRFLRFVRAYKYVSAGENATRSAPGIFANVNEEAVPLSLEGAVAFLWHNIGERALNRGDALRAATSFLQEARVRPEAADRSETLAASLARAFRIEYEAGRFDAAYRIAAIDLEISPDRTSSRDRLLAATLKWIERECDAGRVDEAEKVLDIASATLSVPTDLARLERGASPLIVEAAVRVGDWMRAERISARFATAQPDRVEVARLSRWVDRRRREAFLSARHGACSDPEPAGLFAEMPEAPVAAQE